MSYRLYSWLSLSDSLYTQFPAARGPIVMNDWYCAVTRAWVDGPFAKYYFDYVCARDQRAWAKRGNQCEHFALRAMLEAVDLFRQTIDDGIPPQAESLAVAACKYERDDGAWHEINLWFLDDTWTPWEPQTQAFVTLSAAEIATVQQVIIT